jgi:hypothetical protein
MILEPGVVAVDEVEDLHLGTMAPPVGAGLSLDPWTDCWRSGVLK